MTGPAPRGKPRLLVVDDEESLLEFLALLFRDEGYELDSAASVAEARRLIGRDYDLCL